MVRFSNLGLGGRGELKADINVTPLVAVLLVILFDLMLIQPWFGRPGVEVRLPRAAHTVDKPDRYLFQFEGTILTIRPRMDPRMFIYLNSVPIHEEDLAAKVIESVQSRKDKTVRLEADEDAPYSTVMAAIDSLRKAQIENISLIVEKKRGPFRAQGRH